MSAAYELAIKRQRTAAEPDRSIFVSANAGSGKTRVLVERVSRILLSGTLPDKVLCLTYTKAAAAEMQDRLFEKLGKWAILDDKNLAKALVSLDGEARPRSQKELGRARLLFARALETPGGLKVQTIHAFCERILRRFPLEAGIQPGTDAIDEAQMRALYQHVWEEIEAKAVQEPTGEIARAITVLAAQKNDGDMDDLYGWMMGNAYKIDAWQKDGGVQALAKTLGIESGLSPHQAMCDAWEQAPKADLENAARDLQNSSTKDQTKAKYIQNALRADNAQEAYQNYVQMILTQGGTPNANMVTKGAGALAISLFGNKSREYGPEAIRMIAASQRVKSAHALELTRAIYDLAVLAVAKYRALKAKQLVIDFDDQVYLVRRLLLDTHARDWVRYKLDGGVSHILVDEAQDTSGAQWDIIDALAEEFFQPAPDEDPRRPRTLFAVGDEKQSIYSFQGADPKLFLQKIQKLSQKDKASSEVKMNMSFRSCAHILKLVDTVFYEQGGIEDMFDAGVFPPGSDKGSHAAFREEPGYIELWPPATNPPQLDTETPWKPVPVDAPEQGSPREQLAVQIAIQIKTWLADGEPVYVKKEGESGFTVRPMQARDIMILVTKRTDFFDGVIRNLKQQGVPVAGADKLKLTASVAVRDLLSLAKFVLLPSDDLSLAEVLKSPLFGWDDEALFALAYGRPASLWDALPAGEDKAVLQKFIKLAQSSAPYEFFARILSMVSGIDGVSFLQKFYDRLGHECADALEGFLARALAHQRRGAPSLSVFVWEMLGDAQTLSRVMDNEQNEVRVMTVHGAKGLEAPVVILPDTTQLPPTGKDAVFAVGVGFAFNPGAKNQPEAFEALKEEQKKKALRESMRLLYVALTRAESRLLICGFESRGQVADGSWYHRIEQALGAVEDTSGFNTPFGEGVCYGTRPTTKAEAEEPGRTILPLPDWARNPAPKPTLSEQIFSPSRLGDDLAPLISVRSPLEGDGRDTGRFERGNIMHKLLQILPDLPVLSRKAAARTYLKNLGLAQSVVADLCTEVFAVLENPDFSFVFDESARAEISLAGGARGFPSHVRFSGQIDRLAVIGNKVWIVDYKSNRNPPKDESLIPVLYIRQMAAYRELVREIYPDKTVYAALLWTARPHLMPLSDALLDRVNWTFVLPS